MARRRRLSPRKATTAKKRVQASPVPPDAMTRHAGRWIALKGRRIVAAADDAKSLRARDDVDDDATTFYVPDADELF